MPDGQQGGVGEEKIAFIPEQSSFCWFKLGRQLCRQSVLLDPVGR